jgi:uncharacterized protein (TIGR00730 family)
MVGIRVAPCARAPGRRAGAVRARVKRAWSRRGAAVGLRRRLAEVRAIMAESGRMPNELHDTRARPLIAVYGSSTVREGDAVYAMAHALGRHLAAFGADVMTGGYSGVMEACSRGAREAGARAVGVTVELFERRGPVNAWVSDRVHTPDLYERLKHIVGRADGFVVAPGSIGTLTELYLTWTLVSVSARPPAPIVLLGGHWRSLLDAHRGEAAVPEALYRYVSLADGPMDAARRVLASHGARVEPS